MRCRAIQSGLLATFLWLAAAPACFGQAWGDDVAKAVTLTGDVSVLRDNYPWAISSGDTVRKGQVIVTGDDGYAVFELSDGSRFEVFQNSRVTFRANPANLTDLLDVWLGRVRVYIHKLGGQPNPNRIHTPTAVISVRGTVFDVLVEDDEETTVVSVEEGLVAVDHRLLPRSDQPTMLGAGESVIVYKNVPLAQGPKLDKGRLAQELGRTMIQILARMPRIGGGGGSSGGGSAPTGGAGGSTGGGTTLPGDTGSTPPPPPPPPTTAPPPPGGGN